MFLLILYFFILFAYFYYVAPAKKASTITSIPTTPVSSSKLNNIPAKKMEKFNSKLPDLHYIQGLPITIPEPAYKADTNFDDRLINDIPSLVRKSKGKNISEIFADVSTDNYNLFAAKKNTVMPSSYTNNYVNVPKISNNFMTSTYTMDKNDPGIDTYTLAPIFATGLPKIN
jgi:hypothetical protein